MVCCLGLMWVVYSGECKLPPRVVSPEKGKARRTSRTPLLQQQVLCSLPRNVSVQPAVLVGGLRVSVSTVYAATRGYQALQACIRVGCRPVGRVCAQLMNNKPGDSGVGRKPADERRYV